MAKDNMVSLQGKRGSEEIGAESKDEPFFPLSLWVNDPEIQKLGLQDAEVGEEHELVAKVKITSVSVDESEGSPKRTSVTLTLLEGEVNSDHGESDDARGKKLFDRK